ncbi:hypothetical protein WG66_000683 [Moniliophthora roreri]|uniref:Uncharacterized protein n=1 Tax=Moniliophthora roreri TaxID=221103 RepID=A0A0W0F649_MONRR|nr:hypothetical protein WG66_000683 [Moniliophthora roreri]
MDNDNGFARYQSRQDDSMMPEPPWARQGQSTISALYEGHPDVSVLATGQERLRIPDTSCTVQIDSTSSGVSTTLDIDQLFRDSVPVHVSVEDERQPGCTRAQNAALYLQVSTNPEDGKHQVNAKHLMTHLQYSNARIKGDDTVTVAFRTEYEGRSETPFCNLNPNNTEGSYYDPHFLPVDRMPLYLSVSAAKEEGELDHVAWLQTKLKEEPGWKKFQDRKHSKALKRRQLFEVYKFAYDAAAKYVGKNLGRRRTTHCDVYKALGRSRDWDCRARKEYQRMVEEYGENGPEEDE